MARAAMQTLRRNVRSWRVTLAPSGVIVNGSGGGFYWVLPYGARGGNSDNVRRTVFGIDVHACRWIASAVYFGRRRHG
jgi:hypothetical protein